MILPLENLDLNEVGLLFLLVGALSVIRERRVVPYLIVTLGSLSHGWFSILGVVGLLLVDRFHTQRSKWLLLLNSIGFAALIGAWGMTGYYQTVFLIYGLLTVSIHFRHGGLGVVIPLMMVHQFFPNHAAVEICLPAAGFYLILEEVLRLAKSKQVNTVMCWFEVPVVLAILYPFKDDVLQLLEAPEGLAGLSGALLISMIISGLLYMNKVPFSRWAQSGHHRGARFYRALNRSFSERQIWIQEAKPADVAPDSDFPWFFWGAVTILVLWASLIAVVQGRVG